ncbi:cytochrome P450 [Rhodococcus spelaei]|uniref:Cytochrome P450 n=1 Tax=Rhodococcus spelaei TaxID=2546320 RepID=A0A541B0A9_9NOCA|nr:cytochrome P450 [Rhodococcus spelaei]TQF65748.1 cytochrome P450 [Rhodococcus spelaei]
MTTTLPHPPHRLPVLGDLLTADPAKPALNLMAQARSLGPIFETRIFNQELTVVSGTDLYAELCDDKRFGKHIGFALVAGREILEDALFTAHTTEPNWSSAHNILMPAFTLASMKDYHDVMVDTARELIGYWDARAASGPVDVHTDTSKLTLETIGRIGFGYDFRSFSSPEPDPYAAAVMRTFAYAGRSTYRVPVHWIDRLVRHRAIVQNDADVAYIRSVVDDVIRARRANPDDQPDDLLALMLTTADPETGRRLSDENIRNQVITFLNAGHETTSGTMSFALHLLATHPDIADRVRDEVYGLWPAGDDPEPAFADVHKLKYLRRVVDETLRLWPIGPAFFREPLQDTTIGGHPVRRGQAMLALTLAVHRDPVWGPDPEAFDPDRFLPERARTRPPGIYKPFGTGLRACIGRQLALHETVLALALILHRYDLEPDPDYRLEVAEEFTLKPANLRLGLRRR